MRKTLRFHLMLVLLLAISAAVQAQAPQSAQETANPPIPNFVEFSDRIGTGGQPTDEGLKQIAGKGYKVLINIRASGEQIDFAAEEKLAMQLGMRYYMVPFLSKEPSEEQALAFNALLSSLKESKVFIHCGSGNRVGSLMMIYLALEEGLPADKAEQEAKKIGLRGADLLDFARQVIDRHKK